MSLQFFRVKPIQAGKLGAIIVVLLVAAGGIFGLIPGQGFTGLFLIIALSIGLVLVVAAETIHAGYRATVTDTGLREHLTTSSWVTVARVIEAVSVVVGTGGVVLLISRLPDEPPAGPGAIGVLFIVTGLSAVVLGGSLIRSLAEYYGYRHADAA
jgi:ABC-type polysaccharide/polyol phosphate export permease